MVDQVVFVVSEVSQVGEVRRQATRYAEAAGFGEVKQGNVAIVATELANNLLRHAQRGHIFLQTVNTSQGKAIELLSIDTGPGIANLALSLQDGYSTAGTPGNGLGAIKRLSTHFDIYSLPERGTVVYSQIGGDRSIANLEESFQVGSVSLAMAGEIACGDSWNSSFAAAPSTNFRLIVSDGLGHGPLAAEAATGANQVFDSDSSMDPELLLQKIHQRLNGTRGAAVAVACLNEQNQRISYAGVGNISGTIISSRARQGLVSHNGIVGVKLQKVQRFEYPYENNGLLIMHSDGLKTRWSFDEYPGLQLRHPALIAGVLYRDFCRGSDDVTVVVVRLSHSRI